MKEKQWYVVDMMPITRRIFSYPIVRIFAHAVSKRGAILIARKTLKSSKSYYKKLKYKPYVCYFGDEDKFFPDGPVV